jgi:poly-gamma-glutamate synthesis protein (capsule biosynthesis protein)
MVAPAPRTQPDVTSEPPVVRLAFAGDTYAEGPLAYRLQAGGRDYVGPFTPILRRADVAMLNLEAAITTATTPEPKTYTFSAPEAILPALRRSGIDVVSMANNHGMDFGLPGLRDSLRAQRRSKGPAVIGIGRDAEQAYAPHIATVKGQRIAFFTASHVIDDYLKDTWVAGPFKPGIASAYEPDVERLIDGVEQHRSDVETIVVHLHWGVERLTCPTEDQIRLARRLKKAGADVIVGGHQHRLNGGGMLGRAFVHYGLGNFLFQAASAESDRTGVLTVDVRGREIVRYRWRPGRIVAAVPQRLQGTEAASELAYWESLRQCTGLTRN